MASISAPRLTQTKCADCPIRHRAVCAHCEQDELSELERIKSYRSYAAGEPIAWAGEKLALVGSVVEGVAMLSSTLADGRRQMVGLLFPVGLPRPARPLQPALRRGRGDAGDALHVPADRVRADGRAHPPHRAARLLEMTLDDLDAAREWMLLLGRKTAREKIASLFVIMARRDAQLKQKSGGFGLRFPLYITRESMADYLGLTIETVSRQISTLKPRGSDPARGEPGRPHSRLRPPARGGGRRFRWRRPELQSPPPGPSEPAARSHAVSVDRRERCRRTGEEPS
jgi:CRP/FNR family transcriptional regulator, anaerobic regulatory protein